MAVKRKAAEAFSGSKIKQAVVRQPETPQLSAFAAARARLAAAEAAEAQQAQNDEDEAASISVPQGDAATPSELYDSDDVQDDVHETSAPVRQQLPLQISPGLTDRIPLSSANIKVQRNDQDSTIISIPQGSFVTVVGEYVLSVQSGAVALYGATLYPKSAPCRVYAYTTHVVPQITATISDTVISITQTQAQSQKLAALAPAFRNIAGPERDGPSYLVVDSENQGLLPRSTSILDTTAEYQTVLTKLAMKWETEGRNLTLACIGGKSTGKSTFVKHAVNKLLTKTSAKTCYYLDLDPGQPEFGPPGQLYLVEISAPVLGTPYTHFAARQNPTYRLVAAQTIAALSFRDAPGYYLDCVRSLFANKQLTTARQAGCPLVVNTCGWTKDLGARVLVDILDFGITDAVVINHVDSLVVNAANAKCKDVYQLERQLVNVKIPRTPGECRQMQTMAYMHSRNLHKTSLVDWEDQPVSRWRPWLVDYSATTGAITAIASYGQPIVPKHLAEVIDGSLVAIVTTDEDLQEDEQDIVRTPEELPYLQGQRLLNPQFSQYHGLALIRGIDVEMKQLQLLTPLDSASIGMLMQKTVVLVRGAFDSPDWAYLSDLNFDDSLSKIARPWVESQTLFGIGAAVWRQRRAPMKNTRG